jgi:hypothetical protein
MPAFFEKEKQASSCVQEAFSNFFERRKVLLPW